jgi:Glycosyltransferases, probably involved in cell wall biogenesis
MTTAAFVLFWVSSGALAWVYVAYPLIAAAWGSLWPVRLSTVAPWPSLVTVGLAVHNGADQLEERIANILGDRPPFALEVIVASDGSSDATGATVRALVSAGVQVRLLELPRRGQSAAQSAIFDAARSDFVVLTDLETRFAPGCVAALLAPFADERVGCVTGVLHWRFDEETQTAQNEGLYWRYEQAVRRWESRTGWLAAGTGALLAVRKSIYQPAPSHASLDQILPLFCCAVGSFVVVAPDARGTDRGTASLADQFATRIRIAIQGIEANLRMSVHVTPWRRPGCFLAIWSHKVLRWATPLFGTAATVAGIVLYASGRTPLYLLPAAAAALLGLLAVTGYAGLRLRRPVPFTGLALSIVAVNLAFTVAWLNVLLRRRVAAWEPARSG